MTDKELARLNRAQLLEMLIEKNTEISMLRAQLEEATAARPVVCSVPAQRVGSLAESALEVNRVFEAAQSAADQYLAAVEQRVREQEATCARLEAESRENAEKLLLETELRCRRMERDTQLRCAELRQTAEQDAALRWDELFSRLDRIAGENSRMMLRMESSDAPAERAADKKRKWSL